MHTIALDQMLTGRTSETEMSPQAPQQANEASIALHGIFTARSHCEWDNQSQPCSNAMNRLPHKMHPLRHYSN